MLPRYFKTKFQKNSEFYFSMYFKNFTVNFASKSNEYKG